MKQKTYSDYVPAVREEKIHEAVQKGIQYMEQNIPAYTPRGMLLMMQMRYISSWFWVAQFVLLLGAVILSIHFSGSTVSAEESEMAGMIVFRLAPVLCLLAIPEMVKDLYYDMSELENSCKNDSTVVLQLRLIIVGLTDVVTLTMTAALLAGSLRQEVLMTVIHGMVPFVWISAANLLILKALRLRGRLSGVFLTLLPVALSWVVRLQVKAFQAEHMLLWTIVLAGGMMLLAAELITMNREMAKEGVKQWN